MMNKRFFLYLGLFYCAFIWGFTFVITKWALNGVNPIVMVCIRFIISAVIFLPFVWKNKFLYLKESLVLSLFLSTLYLTQTIGLVYTTASNSGFITGLFIIFIPIFSLIFKKKKISVIEIITIFFAITGLWLLTSGIEGINFGDFLTLIAAMSYSAHLLITDKYVKDNYDIVVLAFHQFWMVGVISLIFIFIFGYKIVITTKSLGWIVFLAVFPTVFAFLIQMKAQKTIEPFKVGVIFCLEPVFAAFFAWTIGGEEFRIDKALGGFLIVFAMFINEIGRIDNKSFFIFLKEKVKIT